MQNSILPTQVGFIPSGMHPTNGFQSSQLVFGKNITGGWQAVGFGIDGQPDVLQGLTINISSNQTVPVATPIVVRMRPEDIVAIILANPNAPSDFNFTFKEVAICDGGIEKRMVVLASQVYPVP